MKKKFLVISGSAVLVTALYFGISFAATGPNRNSEQGPVSKVTASDVEEKKEHELMRIDNLLSSLDKQGSVTPNLASPNGLISGSDTGSRHIEHSHNVNTDLLDQINDLRAKIAADTDAGQLRDDMRALSDLMAGGTK